MIKFLTVLFTFLMFTTTASAAPQPMLLERHSTWAAYSFPESGAKVCFMTASPVKDEGKYTRRGDIYAMITQRPKANTRDVISFIAGYTFKTGSEVKVTVDGKTFTLFTQGDTAWTQSSAADRQLAQAMRSGSKMIVQGRSSRGTVTTDTYSLTGTAAAYKASLRACGL